MRLALLSAASVAGGVVAYALLVSLAHSTSAALIRIATGMVLGLALDPVVMAVRRRLNCRRSVAVAFVGIGIIAAFTVLVLVMAPPAVEQAERFGSELPGTVRHMYTFPFIGPKLADANAASKVQQWAKDLPGRVDTATVTRITNTVVSGAAALFTIVLVAIGVMLDGELLVARIRRLIPPAQRERADRIGRIFYRIVARYFAGSLFLASLAGLYVLAVGLILGVPLIPLAAVWMVMCDLIPQVGGFLGGSFFVLLATTHSVGTGVVAAILYISFQTFENHVIGPMIVGVAIDLSPPVTMIAALSGAAAIGVPGALIATPLVGTIKALYMELRGIEPTHRRRRPKIPRLPWRREPIPE
jgi:predicted PurR-regulated permease PerM